MGTVISGGILSLKRYLKRRCDGRCYYCGQVATPLTKDHKIPQSRGGCNSYFNLVPACYDCNQRKADMTVHEFRLVYFDGDPSCMFFGEMYKSITLTDTSYWNDSDIPRQHHTGTFVPE